MKSLKRGALRIAEDYIVELASLARHYFKLCNAL
jgi:hypothetical protein